MKRRVVVIGAGLAGSLLCNELVKEAEVTLLEIGEKDRIRYPSIAFDRKPLGHVRTFCYGGGGTTNLWHNGLIPIDLRDVVHEDFREALADSLPFMNDAAARLFFTGAYSRAYQDAVAEVSAILSRAGIEADGIDCVLYPKKFQKLTVDSRVRTFYDVRTLRFACADRRISSVKFVVGSQEHSIEPDTVIVSAGAMGSPRILRDIIASSGSQFEALGTGFIDHPLGFVGKIRFKKETAPLVDQLSTLDRGDYIIRSALRFRSSCGQYTCGVFLRPALTIHNSLPIYKYKSSLGATTGLTRLRNALSWKLFHPDIVAEVVAHVFGVNIPSRTYNVLFVGEQRRGGNRVYNEGNELRVDWSISSEELAAYRSILRRLGDNLATVADEVNIETNLTEDWLWSGAHHSGTTPLGNNAGDLVDANLKLKFCDNVYVCDGSVIQEHSYANTGLTIGQLALRLASTVLARH